MAADPAVIKITATPTSPSPGETVNFVVTYSNVGGSVSDKFDLIIDYSESTFTNISLNNSKNCSDLKMLINCSFAKSTKPIETMSFKAKVSTTVQKGAKILTVAYVDALGNKSDNVKNNSASITTTIGAMSSGKISQAGLPAALGLTKSVKLDKPSKNQGVAVFDVENEANWETSSLFTTGLKFMIRAKESLAWVLDITDSGFHNPAIKSSYLKVLTIVNSLFIIGLLAIAAMWMFSILIPRAYLKRVVLIYGMAVIFVNFALPLNQLLIDTTNLLQTTFMDGVKITNIVEIPNYNDKKAVGYQNETNFLKQSDTSKLTLNLSDVSNGGASGGASGGTSKTTTPTITVKPSSISIGKITQDHLKEGYVGSITGSSGTGGSIKLLPTTNYPEIKLNASQGVELINANKFNPDFEHSIFAFVMMALTSLAYFGMALILMLRIVILWALMIVSPALFLLIIFQSTRSYFVNWLGLYARWLLIGPLMALGIAVVVNIWKTTGLPITSSYSGGQFGVFTNIGFFLPGKDTANTLSTTSQMMEYILFLIMLYLPILFAFMLTRQKTWAGAISTIIEKRGAVQKPVGEPIGGSGREIQSGQEGEKKSATPSFGQNLKGFLNDKFTKAAGPAIPTTMKDGGIAIKEGKTNLENAAHFLPENLAKSDVKSMVDLASGSAKGSRNGHKKAIERLASPQTITDPQERKKVNAVREEISNRAQQGDAEAMRMMGEINQVGQSSAAVESSSPAGGSIETLIQSTKEVVKEKETIEKETTEKDTATTSGSAVGDGRVHSVDTKNVDKSDDDQDDEPVNDDKEDSDDDKDEEESDEKDKERKSRRK